MSDDVTYRIHRGQNPDYTKHTVTKRTAHTVTFLDNMNRLQREQINTSYHLHVKTEREAIAYCLRVSKARILQAQHAIEKYTEMIEKYEAML
jgi:hypothetical protein